MVHANQLLGDYTGCSRQVIFSDISDIQNDIPLRGVSSPARETARKGSYAAWRSPVLAPGQQGSAPAGDALARCLRGIAFHGRVPRQGGRVIDKPVLRLMLARRLLELVWRRGGRSWLSSPPRRHALRYSQRLRELIGNPGSHLVRTGNNAETLILLGHGRVVPGKPGKPTRQSVERFPRCRCFR